MGLIYLVENKINGKKYIGQCITQLNYRKAKHFSAAFKFNSQSRFHEALRKYGKRNFKWEIIENNVAVDYLDNREIFWIDFYDTLKSGYNMTSGGGTIRGYHHTLETKEHLKNVMKGKSNLDHYINRYGEIEGKNRYEDYINKLKERKGKPRLELLMERYGEEEGQKRYDEFIKKLRVSRLGKITPEETKIKISKKGRGIKRSKEFKEKLKNRVFTKEHKEKIGNAHRGKNISKETIEKWKISRKGYNHSEETKLKISQGLKNHYKQKEG